MRLLSCAPRALRLHLSQRQKPVPPSKAQKPRTRASHMQPRCAAQRSQPIMVSGELYSTHAPGNPACATVRPGVRSPAVWLGWVVQPGSAPVRDRQAVPHQPGAQVAAGPGQAAAGHAAAILVPVPHLRRQHTRCIRWHAPSAHDTTLHKYPLAQPRSSSAPPRPASRRIAGAELRSQVHASYAAVVQARAAAPAPRGPRAPRLHASRPRAHLAGQVSMVDARPQRVRRLLACRARGAGQAPRR